MTLTAPKNEKEGKSFLPCRTSCLFASTVLCALASLALYPGGLISSKTMPKMPRMPKDQGGLFVLFLAFFVVSAAGIIFNLYMDCHKPKGGGQKEALLIKDMQGNDSSAQQPARPVIP